MCTYFWFPEKVLSEIFICFVAIFGAAGCLMSRAQQKIRCPRFRKLPEMIWRTDGSEVVQVHYPVDDHITGCRQMSSRYENAAGILAG
jgi:hypothetical protein